MRKNYQTKQERLLKEVEEKLKATSYRTGISHLSFKVINAFKKVSRHLFVPYEEESYAYLNRPLPIGEGQTISQPFIVALMTEFLDVQPTDKILEIGTSSGYQAAILSHLASEVYAIEIYPNLARQAQDRFKELGYKNIHTLIGNGGEGWIEYAPFNKIIVTAAADKIPYTLISQLSKNGIMVVPLGEEGGAQSLTVIHKNSKGQISQKSVLPVQFVPFQSL
jgi:protein-L-isoaspartate(D-aspartate) O-methyltransferase